VYKLQVHIVLKYFVSTTNITSTDRTDKEIFTIKIAYNVIISEKNSNV